MGAHQFARSDRCTQVGWAFCTFLSPRHMGVDLNIQGLRHLALWLRWGWCGILGRRFFGRRLGGGGFSGRSLSASGRLLGVGGGGGDRFPLRSFIRVSHTKQPPGRWCGTQPRRYSYGWRRPR